MSEPEKVGFFKKASKWVKDTYEEERRKQQAIKDAETAFYAEAAEKYGRLAASEVFDDRRIELFDGGYVRVGGYLNRKGGPKPKEMTNSGDMDYVVAYDTPFEKLRAVKTTTQIQDKSAGGRALAATASFGISEMTSNEKRIIFLTISTDQETYTFKEKGKMKRASDSIASKLEVTGQGILDNLANAHHSPTSAPTPAASPSVADQLRDLAALHKEGVLTDEEFATAKAKLLG